MDKQSELEIKMAVLDTSLARQLSWVAAADGKVPAIFGIDMAMLGCLCVLFPAGGQWTIYQAIFSSLAALGLLASVFSLGLVAFPRLSGPKGSIVFFGGIIQYAEDAFIKKALLVPSEDMLHDLARQVYRNAEIASTKYTYVRYAMWCMYGSAPFWLTAITLLYIKRCV